MRIGWSIAALVIIWIVGVSSDELPDRALKSPKTKNVSNSNETGTNPDQFTLTTTPDRSTYLFVTGDRLRVRSGPSTSHAVVGHLDRGDRIRLQEEDGDWVKAVTSFGSGWVSSKFVSIERPSVAAASKPQPSRTIAAPTNQEIREARKAIIRQSIQGYSGSCPCPYNTDRAGRRCGGRSAWSRPGGYSPICYDSDVSDARVNSYLARKR